MTVNISTALALCSMRSAMVSMLSTNLVRRNHSSTAATTVGKPTCTITRESMSIHPPRPLPLGIGGAAGIDGVGESGIDGSGLHRGGGGRPLRRGRRSREQQVDPGDVRWDTVGDRGYDTAGLHNLAWLAQGRELHDRTGGGPPEVLRHGPQNPGTTTSGRTGGSRCARGARWSGWTGQPWSARTTNRTNRARDPARPDTASATRKSSSSHRSLITWCSCRPRRAWRRRYGAAHV